MKSRKTSQQENDYYMDGARAIKRLAESLTSSASGNDEEVDEWKISSTSPPSTTPASLSSQFKVCSSELKYLVKELSSSSLKEEGSAVIHNVLQGRLQYFMCAMNHFCNVSSSRNFGMFLVCRIVLSYLFTYSFAEP